jgi:hypothetical protein
MRLPNINGRPNPDFRPADWGRQHGEVTVDRHGHDATVEVVNVLANQVDPSGSLHAE